MVGAPIRAEALRKTTSRQRKADGGVSVNTIYCGV